MLDNKGKQKASLKEKELELRSNELQLHREKFEAEEKKVMSKDVSQWPIVPLGD